MELAFRILATQEPHKHVHSEMEQARKIARATVLVGTPAADLTRLAILATRSLIVLVIKHLAHVRTQKGAVTKLFQTALTALVSTRRARMDTTFKAAIA